MKSMVGILAERAKVSSLELAHKNMVQSVGEQLMVSHDLGDIFHRGAGKLSRVVIFNVDLSDQDISMLESFLDGSSTNYVVAAAVDKAYLNSAEGLKVGNSFADRVKLMQLRNINIKKTEWRKFLVQDLIEVESTYGGADLKIASQVKIDAEDAIDLGEIDLTVDSGHIEVGERGKGNKRKSGAARARVNSAGGLNDAMFDEFEEGEDEYKLDIEDGGANIATLKGESDELFEEYGELDLDLGLEDDIESLTSKPVKRQPIKKPASPTKGIKPGEGKKENKKVEGESEKANTMKEKSHPRKSVEVPEFLGVDGDPDQDDYLMELESLGAPEPTEFDNDYESIESDFLNKDGREELETAENDEDSGENYEEPDFEAEEYEQEDVTSYKNTKRGQNIEEHENEELEEDSKYGFTKKSEDVDTSEEDYGDEEFQDVEDEGYEYSQDVDDEGYENSQYGDYYYGEEDDEEDMGVNLEQSKPKIIPTPRVNKATQTKRQARIFDIDENEPEDVDESIEESKGKGSRFGFGRGKAAATTNSAPVDLGIPQAKLKAPKVNDKQLIKHLDAISKGGYTILVTGSRGAGVTTLSYELALTLAKLGYKTALMDMDLRSRTTALLCPDVAQDLHEMGAKNPIMQALHDPRNLTEVALHTIENLDMFVAPVTIPIKELHMNKENIHPIEVLIARASNQYTFTVVDCPIDLVKLWGPMSYSSVDKFLWVADYSLKGVVDLAITDKEFGRGTLIEASELILNRYDPKVAIAGKRSETAFEDVLFDFTSEYLLLSDYEVTIIGSIPYDLNIQSGLGSKNKYTDTATGDKFLKGILQNM